MVCEPMFKGLIRRINEGMSIDKIGQEMCPEVKHPRRKIVRSIKLCYGKNAPILLEKPSLEYHKPRNKTGQNKKDKVKNSTSEPRPKISIGWLAKSVLDDTIIDNYLRDGTKLSYSDAIWLLWAHADIPEKQGKAHSRYRALRKEIQEIKEDKKL